MTGVNQISRNLIFNILILIKSYLNKQNKLLITTTSTHNFWLQVIHEILDNIESNFPILSVFITLLLRSYEGQLQPGEMKADSLPQIFHTLVLHHKVGFDQGGPAEFTH